MANAGYSSDHKLCHAVTTGLWECRRRIPPIPLPKHNDNDNIHQTVLKNYVIDYYNAFHHPDKTPWYSIDNTKRRRCMNKIIYQMNQYRQKHWYWKAII